MPPDAGEGPGALLDILPVSRETVGRLETFVGLVRKWQPAENLVSPATLPVLWRRHVADSAQLLPLFPTARTWLDIGSGGGFPGMVLACLVAGDRGHHVHLVESNERKCAFLRRVIAEARLPATVHRGRIEAVLANWDAPVDVVTARALAPLPRLLELAEPVLTRSVTGAFHKGRDFEGEIEQASKSWSFDLVIHKSRIEAGSVILKIRHLRSQNRP